MKNWREKIERIFAAISFTEVGEHNLALEMIGECRQPEKSLNPLDRLMAAFTFAEADCHDMANEFLAPETPRRAIRIGGTCTIQDFAQAVGLGDIRLRMVELPV